MSRAFGIMVLIVASIALAAACGAHLPAHANVLEPGIALIYEADGHRGTPSVVEVVNAVRAPTPHARNCVHVRFAPSGTPPTATDRTTCEVDGALRSLSDDGSTWKTLRPLQPGTTLALPTRTGGLSHYRALSVGQETISGVTLAVVETEVLTTDAAGKPLRRLRERFAPAIGTATGGTFEAADDTAPSHWRVTQVFALVEIRHAGGAGR